MSTILIVGHGIAGASLSFALRQSGLSFLVVDSPSANICSAKAGGLCNPVTGRSYKLTWKAKEIFEAFPKFYRAWESELGIQVWHPMPLWRLADTVKNANSLESRLGDASVQDWAKAIPKTQLPENTLCGMELSGGGYVDAEMLLAVNREKLEQEKRFKQIEIDPKESLEKLSQRLGLSLAAVVDCRGIGLQSELPGGVLVPNRGLIAHSDKWPLEQIQIRKGWAIPRHDGKTLFGSTYQPHATDPVPSEKEKAELLDKAQKSGLDIGLIKNIEVGIRPTLKDRKPLAGPHPERKGYYVFGGLGSKGFSLAPWLAPKLANLLRLGQNNMPPEVGPKRFWAGA